MSATINAAATEARVAQRRVTRGLITFVLLTFTFSSIGYTATIVEGETALILLIAPAVAGLVTRFIFYRNLRGFAGPCRHPVGRCWRMRCRSS